MHEAIVWIVITLTLYFMADWLYVRSKRNVFLYPVILPTVVLIIALKTLGVPADKYTLYMAPLYILLMAATSALAIPLYRNRSVIRDHSMPVIAAIISGSITGVGSALFCAYVLNADALVIKSLTTKSITTPFAVELMPLIGGSVPIAVSVIVMTGLIVASIGPAFMRYVGIEDDIAVGLAMGTAGHGLGMAEAVRRSDLMGAAAATAMVLNGILTTLVLSFLTH